MGEISKGIEVLALELCSIQDEIAQLEEKLKAKKGRANEIKTKELAELVDMEGFQAGSKFTLANGRVVAVKEYFSSSIPTLTAVEKEKDPFKQGVLLERRKGAFKWLDDNKKGDLIKNEVYVKFNREEADKAKLLVQWLTDKGLSCQRDENVHPQTLNAALKEAMANGETVPMDTFNIVRGVVVDVK